jgi:beta-N-acetylhexosaminidase
VTRPRSRPTRRRRALIAVPVAAALAALGGAIVGAHSGDRGDSGDDNGSGEGAGAASDRSREPACPPGVAARPRRLVGQMLVVRMEDVARGALRRRARDGEVGGVILFPSAGLPPAEVADQVAALRRAAERGGSPAPLVAIDQEGGEVRRLPSLPPLRSPAEIAAVGKAAARDEGAATGRALNELGIDVDLAPVLDVPAISGSFIASRALGSDPDRVAELGVAFANGLRDQGVAATAKHFPGLGLATANTDLGPSVIEATDRSLQRGLIPFRAAVDAGMPMVMVSNATYAGIDPARPASQSPSVVRELRERIGFDGVVITDDLGAGALTGAGLDEGEAAVGAARAGADLLLLALSDGRAASRALLRALRRGTLDRDALVASCARVSALREALGADSPAAGR